MSLIADRRAYFLFMLSLCPFINAQTINQNNHTSGIASHYKIAENYQLLGGKSQLEFRAEIVCGQTIIICLCVQLQWITFPKVGFPENKSTTNFNLLHVNLIFR